MPWDKIWVSTAKNDLFISLTFKIGLSKLSTEKVVLMLAQATKSTFLARPQYSIWCQLCLKSRWLELVTSQK